jgi:uncharacterized membrane protein
VLRRETVFWFVVVVAIALGTVFRMVHVEHRLFWQDEAATALRISGHVDPEFRSIFDDRVHPVADITHFQQYDPHRGVWATIHGLAVEEPHHPPLFYILDHYWAMIFGSSIPALRALALIFGVLAIVAVYWFALELTSNRFAAGTAAALMAVSPFFVNYAGEAREYTLWAMMICVTSAVLLRAVRRSAPAIWVWYAVTMTIALYSDLLMLFVLVGHALYVLAIGHRNRNILISFALSGGAALVLFSPWIIIDLVRSRRIAVEMAWGFNPYPPRLYLEKWVFNFGAVLFDAEYTNMLLAPIAGVLLLFMLYGFIRAMRDETVSTRWMLLTLGGAIAVQQIATDILMHGHESTTARYLLPLWTALLVGLALFFGRRFMDASSRSAGVWLAVLCIVLLGSTVSSAINSSAIAWWDNNDNTPSTEIASVINASGPDPLVVSEGYWAEVMVLSHYVRPDTNFLLFKGEPPFPMQLARNSFLLVPSQTTLAAFRREPQYQLVPVPIQPMTSEAMLGFHRALKKTEATLANPIVWRKGFLYRLETRVASR